MGFWHNVENECEYRGISRKELASAADFSVHTISNGIKRNSIPYADTALKVAKFLGVSLEYLLGMDEVSENPTINPQISEIENYLKRFSPNDLDVILNVTKALNEKY